MAGNGDIRQKIVLEGEKEYSSALKEAQRNLKTLRSELKAETAELGNNATAQQKNEVKAKNLQKQIKEQEKIVKTYEKALSEVREKYGDNEEAISKWEVKLNEARASLANMKNSLDDAGTSIQNLGAKAKSGGDMATVATNAFADSLGRIADVGESISGSIEGFFGGMVSTIRDAIGALWDELMDVAARANEWGDIAGYWNTSATNIQKWYHAVEGTYNSFADLSSAVTRIVEGDQKKIAEASGVSAENYADKWEYAMAVMDSLGKMSYEERLAATADIFGEKRATKVLDLLNDWEKIQANLSRYDAEDGGFGLTEENLQTASELAEKVANLKESWQALKDMAVVELFGDLALNITGNLQNIVDAFKDYFSAETDEERQAAKDKIKANIEEMFTTIGEAIRDGIEILRQVAADLKQSENETVKAIGGLLDSLLDLFEWIAKPENWGAVKTAFEALLAIWTGSKIITAISNLASLGANLRTVFSFGKTGGGGTGGSPVVPTTGAGGGILAKYLAPALKAVAPYAAGAVLSAAAFYGIAKYASSGNIEIAETPDATRYAGSSSAETIQRSGRGILNAGTANAEWQIRYLAANLNDELLETFNYHDEERGDSNLLFDLLGMNDPQTSAAIWRMWQASGNNMRDLSPEWQQRLQWGQEAYQQIMQSGGELDFIPLLTRLQTHFRNSGYYDENGNWSVPGATVPSDWWTGGGTNGSSLSSAVDNLNTLPGQMKEAVKNGISGIKVYMDGAEVGYLIAPYVSQEIARVAN